MRKSEKKRSINGTVYKTKIMVGIGATVGAGGVAHNADFHEGNEKLKILLCYGF